MATDPARQEPYEEEGIGGESIGARRSGGGSTSTNWSEQPTYTTAVARSSLGGGIVALHTAAKALPDGERDL